MTPLLVEALFAVVFAWALGSYLRRWDPLERDVMLVFSALAVLFVLAVVQVLVGKPPWPLTAVASAWLLGQPYLTLRLVARVRRVPGWVRWTTLVGWLATALPVLVVPPPLPAPVILPLVAVFCFGEVAAALFFAQEANRRAGASRVRLWCASVATALFAAAILTAGAGPAAASVGRVIALVSALGYMLAFMPPAWLRLLWSTRAAYMLMRRVLDAPADELPETTWRRYSEAVCEVTGADGTVVLVSSKGRVVEVASAGVAAAPGSGVHTAEEFDQLLTNVGTVEVDASGRGGGGLGGGGRGGLGRGGGRRGDNHGSELAVLLAHRHGTRFVTAVPLNRPSGRGALVLLNHHRRLFADDDVILFGELGRQAAILAERGAVLVERQHLAEERAAAAQAANAASRAKSEFVANMSHELRTPLNSIIGFSELMQDEQAIGDARLVPAEWVGHVHRSGRHLLGLINDVLDLAKIEAGRVELHLAPVDLLSVVTEAVTSLRPLFNDKRLHVTTSVPPVFVQADPIRLRQILTNLLSNAIKFTPDEGHIVVAAGYADTEVEISVADTGSGIAVADQARIFEEFQQVGDPALHHVGTGLGLALTRRLVEAHGGRIDLESSPGHGSRFTIHLPMPDLAALGVPEPTRLAISDAMAGKAALGGGRGGILIIEDDPAAGSLLGTHLHRAGYQVSIAATGTAGIAAARAHEPDVILLDIDLPDIDGWEVLSRLKDDEQLRHVPVAIVSVVDDHQAVGCALGAVDYFVKPVNHDRLLTWLVRHGLVPPLNGTAINVLAIDDDLGTLTLVERFLRREGLNVVCASRGMDGLRLARRHPFDLIICDLLMPDLDGFSVIAALHDDPATRDIPVLVLTCHDLTDAEKDRLHGKIVGVGSKGGTAPVSVEACLARITEFATSTARHHHAGQPVEAAPTTDQATSVSLGWPAAGPQNR